LLSAVALLPASPTVYLQRRSKVMGGGLPSSKRQTSSKCIQNTRANAGRLLDRVNTL